MYNIQVTSRKEISYLGSGSLANKPHRAVNSQHLVIKVDDNAMHQV